MRKFFIFALLLAAPAILAQGKKVEQKAEQKSKLKAGVYAHFETSMGAFTCELYERQAPVTVANFIGLADGTKEYKDPRTGRPTKGKPWYDNTTFHRIVDGFMIQGGDPTGTGTGEPGYKFQNETSPELKHDREGRLSMANSGPNTNGAQFFITLAPKDYLDGGYTIFGQVVEGMDVVKKIGKVPVEAGPGGERSKPLTPVTLKKVTIERVKQ